MSDEGAVSRGSVITVLQATEISVAVSGANITVVKEGIPEVYILPEFVGRKLLHRLAAKYGIRIEWFYHPEMICRGSSAKQ